MLEGLIVSSGYKDSNKELGDSIISKCVVGIVLSAGSDSLANKSVIFFET